MMTYPIHRSALFAAAMMCGTALQAQTSNQTDNPAPPPRTVNILVGFGPQIAPRFPGDADPSVSVFPQIEVWNSDEPFPAEAPDEGITIPLVGEEGGPQAGLTVIFAPQRRADDVGLAVDKVGFGAEVGGFASLYLADALRLRTEIRQGLGAHNALTGEVRADYVVRTAGDAVVATIGPRVRWGSGKYNQRYFGVTPAEAARTGLAAFDAGSGIYAYGVAAGAQFRVTDRWGLYGFATYDRLQGATTDSPLIRSIGTRDQWTVGAALTYTFRIVR
jgi:MipA family protein